MSLSLIICLFGEVHSKCSTEAPAGEPPTKATRKGCLVTQYQRMTGIASSNRLARRPTYITGQFSFSRLCGLTNPYLEALHGAREGMEKPMELPLGIVCILYVIAA